MPNSEGEHLEDMLVFGFIFLGPRWPLWLRLCDELCWLTLAFAIAEKRNAEAWAVHHLIGMRSRRAPGVWHSFIPSSTVILHRSLQSPCWSRCETTRGERGMYRLGVVSRIMFA